MHLKTETVQRGSTSLLATHKVLRNTYTLLGMTLLFSAAAAWFAVVTKAAPLNILLLLVGTYGLMFLVHMTRNSIWGLVSTFAFTGFMGYSLGPILNFYLSSQANGGELIMTALGGTGLIFFALSAYVLTTRRDMSFMGGFLFVGTIVAIVASLAMLFFQVPALQLALSAAFVLLSSGWILWQTSAIIHGGERNYIIATIGLYVQIYNLFLSLLHLLSAFSNRD